MKMDDVEAVFSKWNPMQGSYADQTYNAYASGYPGCSSQPAISGKKGSSQFKNARYPYLVFKRYPKGLTATGASNLCRNYARVVRASINKNIIFVDFETLADMDAAFEGLLKTEMGIVVEIGKNVILKKSEMDPKAAAGIPSISDPTGWEMQAPHVTMPTSQDRKIPIQYELPDRPQFIVPTIVTLKDYQKSDNLLKINDPLKHFLIESDAHDFERWCLRSNRKFGPFESKKYKVKTGRSYISESEKFAKTMMNKTQASMSSYNPVTDALEYFGEGCNQVVCQNCDLTRVEYYRKPTRAVGQPMKYMPQNDDEVIITAIVNVNHVFIRSTNPEVVEKYNDIICDIDLAGRQAVPLREPPVLGQIVFAVFEGQFCRAIVLNIDDLELVKVCHIDYGNIDEKPMQQLYEAPEFVKYFPRCSMPVFLKDVPNYYMTDRMRLHLYEVLLNKPFRLKYDKEADSLDDRNAYRVELLSELCERSLNTFIKQVFLAKGSTEDDKARYLSPDIGLLQDNLPEGDNVKLVVMDNTMFKNFGVITCTTKAMALEIQKFQKDLEIYAESYLEPSVPMEGGYCLARYRVDNKWYRAQCYQRNGDGFPTVSFIDYGNLDCFHYSNMRPYPPEFYVKIYSNDCEIEGMPEVIDDKMNEKLKRLMPIGAEVEFENVKKLEKNNYIVKFPKIFEDLTAEES